jgi:dynein heavy chain
VSKYCTEPVPTLELSLCAGLLRLLDSMLDEMREEPVEAEESKKLSSKKKAKKLVDVAAQTAAEIQRPHLVSKFTIPAAGEARYLECCFIFSLVWTVGGSCDSAGRMQFDKFLRTLLSGQCPDEEWNLGPTYNWDPPTSKPAALLPPKGLVYDYMFDKATMQWVHWLDTMQPGEDRIPEEASFTDIVVPSSDTIRYSYLLEILITHGHHPLLAGPTGTGKTIYIKRKLAVGGGLDPDRWTSLALNFSAQTSSRQTQDLVDSRLDKRRRGVFGPPLGKRCVVFVDDLNMPRQEEYGAQPPIELLRQFMDYTGWFDLNDQTFRTLVGLQFLAAMGPPGGGRNPVTQRYLRHFNLVSVTPFDEDSMVRIFESILAWWCKTCKFSETLASQRGALVSASIEIYRAVCSGLLPTPAKSHYTFNLRDLSKVIQGVESSHTVGDFSELIRLWAHENVRIYSDRLINDQDREWFMDRLQELVPKHFKMEFNKVFAMPKSLLMDPVSVEEGRGSKGKLPPKERKERDRQLANHALATLQFCDWMSDGPAGDRPYKEIVDAGNAEAKVNTYLAEHNSLSPKPMNLVMFQFAIQHICRISRIIRQPLGNALLVGVGGSGRQSLTKLATFISEYELFQIEVTSAYGKAEWHDDLKVALRQAGEAGKPTVFLMTDTQIKYEFFVEDISGIFNTGQVANLFAVDEQSNIRENVRAAAKAARRQQSEQELDDFFVERCKANLHVVLCISPVGDALRTYLRMFPSLANCCTIDWFQAWPPEALTSVAKAELRTLHMSPAMYEATVTLCNEIHVYVREESSQRFLREVRRVVYVTPTSFLALISSFKLLLERRQAAVTQLQQRYGNGLHKLLQTEGQVKGMQEELEALQPQLVVSATETADLMKVIDAETILANEQRVLVEADEAEALESAAAAQAIAAECDVDLAVAMPVLNKAIKALNTLTKNDMVELKSMGKPPKGVKIVMEGICIYKSAKPARTKDPSTGRFFMDYWEPSKKIINDSNFLASLQTYDKDNIPQDIIDKIRPYLNNPEFNPDKVRKASKAAYGLACWAIAIESYDRVAKVVAPKKIKLVSAQGTLAVVMSELAVKQAQLAEVQAKIAALNTKLEESKQRLKALEDESDNCKAKLERASKLISGLGGEKDRWTMMQVNLKEAYINLDGDCLLSAAMIAYLGPFTGAFREEMTDRFHARCVDMNIPCSAKFSLATILGDPVTIRQWMVQGLPSDGLSVDNAIVATNARRWPLMIDPQGQANKWVCQMEKDKKLIVVKPADPKLTAKLEIAIRSGMPLLLQDVGETLESFLEPVLLRQTFQSAGTLCLKLGDNTIEYSTDFRLYITTKLSNPHYLPEVQVKVSLLNFMITMDGLRAQLLEEVVAKEKPELQKEKNNLIVQGAENQKQMKEAEDKILEVLSKSEGNLLDDSSAVDILSDMKVFANEVAERQKVADTTERTIDAVRLSYTPFALRGASLYFTVNSTAALDPMYQFSLVWFIRLFKQSMDTAAPARRVQDRLTNMKDAFLLLVYNAVCRSLFEKDKTLFALLLAVTIHRELGTLVAAEWRFLLTGMAPPAAPTGVGEANLKPAEWMPERVWQEVMSLSALGKTFAGLPQSVRAHINKWKKVYDSPEPHREALPGERWEELPLFQKLLILRAIRPDKVVAAVEDYISEELGEQFVTPPPFDLLATFHESTAVTPLVFVLSAGTDPSGELLAFADSRRQTVRTISLGQGQGDKAEQAIKSSRGDGTWVVLQNCHLAASWMGRLEQVCESFTVETCVDAFRLWLTSYPSASFPVSILQNSVKMTNEPPKGLRTNLLRLYKSEPIYSLQRAKLFESCGHPAFQKLLYGLCFFHATVQERLKFGPLGFNVPYQFSDADFHISARQLQMFLSEADDNNVPFKALQYTTGECNYGGRVTDDHDRTCLISLLDRVYCPEILQAHFNFSPSGNYTVPRGMSIEGYWDFILKMPHVAAPEVFGMHENADITKDMQETLSMCAAILLTQERTASSDGASQVTMPAHLRSLKP